MQQLLVDKAMIADSSNGLNNKSDCKDYRRNRLMVGLDLFCLFLGKSLSFVTF